MKLLGLLAAMLLVVGAAVALGGSDDDDGGGRAAGPVALGDVRLVSVESCDDLVEWFRETAEASDFGVAVPMDGGGEVLMAQEDSAASGAPSARATTATTAAADFSTTNVQERDVDEPDTVKTDGEVLVVARPDGVQVVDVRGDAPALLSDVPLEQGGSELLLSGDRVLALTTTWREDPSASQPVSDGDARMMIAPAGKPVTILTSIDISDPSSPRVLETRELPGSYRSARASGDAARIVLVTYPTVTDPAAIETMTVEDWSPNAGDCSSVARTTAPQGLGTTTVLTLDLQGSLAELDRDSVVADAGTIYASTDRLVIATSRWSQTFQPNDAPADSVSTELHAFDISDPATTTYVGSGSVGGYLLNQFSLSEHEGNLRVATTEEAPWDPAGGVSQSDSGVTVLDGSMQEIGRIDGLGVTERIQSVRYMGDIAYVVTFRQTDPLYAIDLSDPRAPRVAGELKVPGYSAYLHPVDDRLYDVQATVVQPLATVMNALSNVSDVSGRSVAVLGLGPLGLLFTQLLKARGAGRVTGVDRVDRRDVGAAFGIDEVVTADVRTWATRLGETDRPSLVVDAIGHAQQHVADAVHALAYGGELLVFGLPDDHYVFPMRAFYRKALRMWSGATRDWTRFLGRAHEHVLRHEVLTTSYVTHTMPVFRAERAYRMYAAPAPGRLKVALIPPE